MKRSRQTPVAEAASGDDTLWEGTAEAGAAGERLGWPLAAGIIVLLSVGLWAGIGLIASLAFG